jgi:hypothetical protein
MLNREDDVIDNFVALIRLSSSQKPSKRICRTSVINPNSEYWASYKWSNYFSDDFCLNLYLPRERLQLYKGSRDLEVINAGVQWGWTAGARISHQYGNIALHLPLLWFLHSKIGVWRFRVLGFLVLERRRDSRASESVRSLLRWRFSSWPMRYG